ncbi:MAG: hypothetical protein GEU76_02155 [Alphaproteobacteria bacterium]|nr:hypothetical protein [Alphaproteobacteria bacterium]
MLLQTESREDDGSTYNEVVGLLRSSRDLEAALAKFTSSGWDRADLSLLARHNVLLPEHLRTDTVELADNPAAERASPVSHTDVRQGRALATGMIGVVAAFAASAVIVVNGGSALLAVLGALIVGGIVIALVAGLGYRIGNVRRQFLREQADHKGIVLWVKIKKPGDEEKAQRIFARLGARNVHVHERGAAS